LSNIYNLIPENLQSNKTITELIREYDNNLKNLDDYTNIVNFDFFLNAYDNLTNDIRKELLGIHLQEIFDIINGFGDNQEVFDEFKRIYESLGVSTANLNIVASIDASISTEYIAASKNFKESKGTQRGFFFVYDLINKAGLNIIDNGNVFNIKEGSLFNQNEPYTYRIESSLYKSVYDASIKKLSHPIGFIQTFNQLINTIFEDNYNYNVNTVVDKFDINCYTYIDGIKQLTTINLLNDTLGRIKNTNTYITNNKETVVVDFIPLSPSSLYKNGYRLIVDSTGLLTLYNRERNYIITDFDYNGLYIGEQIDLYITELELIDTKVGILRPNFETRNILYKDTSIISDISFKEYTIIDSKELKIRYKIFGNTEWVYCNIPLTNKTLSSDKKYFNIKTFTYDDILNFTQDYNGRIVKVFDSACKADYIIRKVYELAVKDYSTENDINKITNTYFDYTGDYFPRNITFDNISWIIGSSLIDPNAAVTTKPFLTIGENDTNNNNYLIGYNNNIYDKQYSKTIPTNDVNIINRNTNYPIYKKTIDDNSYSISSKYTIQPNPDGILWEYNIEELHSKDDIISSDYSIVSEWLIGNGTKDIGIDFNTTTLTNYIVNENIISGDSVNTMLFTSEIYNAYTVTGILDTFKTNNIIETNATTVNAKDDYTKFNIYSSPEWFIGVNIIANDTNQVPIIGDINLSDLVSYDFNVNSINISER